MSACSFIHLLRRAVCPRRSEALFCYKDFYRIGLFVPTRPIPFNVLPCPTKSHDIHHPILALSLSLLYCHVSYRPNMYITLGQLQDPCLQIEVGSKCQNVLLGSEIWRVLFVQYGSHPTHHKIFKYAKLYNSEARSRKRIT